MIQGRWYPKGSAAQYRASLSVQDDLFSLTIEGKEPLSGQANAIVISDRIGRTERKLTLPDGSVFATMDNDAVDRLMLSQSRIKRVINYLESHLIWVICSAILMVFLSFAFVRWGIPSATHQIAKILPQKVSTVIGREGFAFMDEYFLDDSQLSEEKKAVIRQRFQTKIAPAQGTSKVRYTLHFRQWLMGDISVPNAFALPSGDIVITDKLVELSENANEIDAVLLHEIGHVVHRHGLESLIRGSLIAVITQLVVGNSDGFSDFAAGMATGVVGGHYSRQQETAADLYAFKRMLQENINPKYFSQILYRMDSYMTDEMAAQIEHEKEPSSEEEQGVLDYFSSHPKTSERAKQAAYFTQCFEQGLKRCNRN